MRLRSNKILVPTGETSALGMAGRVPRGRPSQAARSSGPGRRGDAAGQPGSQDGQEREAPEGLREAHELGQEAERGRPGEEPEVADGRDGRDPYGSRLSGAFPGGSQDGRYRCGQPHTEEPQAHDRRDRVAGHHPERKPCRREEGAYPREYDRS